MFVRETGDPTRPALVLLHGFPSSSRHYVRLLDRLAENANAYTDGLGPDLAPVAQWWADRHAGQSAIDGLLSRDGTGGSGSPVSEIPSTSTRPSTSPIRRCWSFRAACKRTCS